MPDPDLLKLKKQAEALGRVTADQSYRYVDGPTYQHAEAEHRAAVARLRVLEVRIDQLTALGKRERQYIGIARRQLGVPDDAHAALVSRVTKQRTRSTSDCTAAERLRILTHYKASGFRLKKPTRAGRAPGADMMERQPMLLRIEQLLAELRLPWQYAEAIIRQQRGITDRSVICPAHACTDEELRWLIAALDRQRKRRGANDARQQD